MNQHREISAAAGNSSSNVAESTPANARLLRLFKEMGEISIGDLLGPNPNSDDQKFAEVSLDFYNLLGARVEPERLSWNRGQA